MPYNDVSNKNIQRTFRGIVVKVRFKLKNNLNSMIGAFLTCIVISSCVNPVQCNRPPRFLIDGQTEIVLRLKEGQETPVGKFKPKIIKCSPAVFLTATYESIHNKKKMRLSF